MDKETRTRLRQLANDAIIATFGYDSLTSRLAEALEKCVDELDEICGKCSTCSYCDDHGDYEYGDDDYDSYILADGEDD